MATPHEATIEAGDLRLSLRCLTVTDIPKLSERFQQENWDESVFYLPQIIQCYPEAFIGAFLGDNDLICMCTYICDSQTLDYIGCIIAFLLYPYASSTGPHFAELKVPLNFKFG